MARNFTFRLDQQGVDTLRKEFEALGPAGDAAFKKIAQSSPQLVDAMKRAEDQAERMRTRLTDLGPAVSANDNAFRRATTSAGGFGNVVRQAGFQVGDFAVQVASGQSGVVAFTQQASQLLQIFGPLGAVLGAAVSIAGALGVGFFKTADATKEAKEEAKESEKALTTLNDVMLTSEERALAKEQADRSEAAAILAKKKATEEATIAEKQAQIARLQILQSDNNLRRGRIRSALDQSMGTNGDPLGESALAQLRGELFTAREDARELQEQIDALNSGVNIGNIVKETENARKERDKADEKAAAARKREREEFDRMLEREIKAADAVNAANERRNVSVEKYIQGLENVAAAEELSGVEKKIQLATLEAQNKLIDEQGKKLRDLTQDERERIAAAVRVKDELDEQRRLAEQQAKEQERLADRTMRNIQQGMGDVLFDAFTDKSFSAWDTFKRLGLRALADIAAAMITQNLLGGLVRGAVSSAPALFGGSGGGSALGGLLNFGGASSGSGLSVPGYGGGMIDLGLGGLTTAIDSFGASLGLSSVAGGGNTLYGLAGLEAGAIDAGFIAGEGALSATGSLTGILGGAGLGFGAGTLLNSLVGGKKTGGMIGSGAGALAGAIIGSIIPGVGTILGGLIGGAGGGLLGGLFGPGKGFSGGQINLGVDASGNLITTEAGFKRHKDVEGAKAAAQQFVDSINAQFDQLGLSFSSGGNISSLGFGNKAGSIEWSVGRLLDSGRVQSGNDELDKMIKTMSLGGSADDIMNRLTDLVTVFNALQDPLADDNLTQAEQALKEIGETFDTLRDKAKALGFSTAQLAELEEKRGQAVAKLTEGFDRSIELQILAFTDPLGQAMEALADAQEQRLKEAKAAGADLVEVERLSALERERLLAQVNAPLKDLLTQLTGTTSSPLGSETVLANAEARFNDVRSRALGGDSVARDQLADAARNLLDVSRTAFASSPAFFERFNFVVATLQNILGSSGYAGGTESASPGWHWVGERRPELVHFRGGEKVLPETNGVRFGDVGREIVMALAELTAEMRRMRADFSALKDTVHRQQDTIDRLLSAPLRAVNGR